MTYFISLVLVLLATIIGVLVACMFAIEEWKDIHTKAADLEQQRLYDAERNR